MIVDDFHCGDRFVALLEELAVQHPDSDRLRRSEQHQDLHKQEQGQKCAQAIGATGLDAG